MNQVGEIVFVVSGALIIVIMMLRCRRMDQKQRNAVVTAVFGLFLCARYAALINNISSWVFVIACAGAMSLLAYHNLGFEKGEQTSVN